MTAGSDLDLGDQGTMFTDSILGDRARIVPKAVSKNGPHIGNDVRINTQVFVERVVVEDFVFIGPHKVFTDDKHPHCPLYADCVPKLHVGSFVSSERMSLLRQECALATTVRYLAARLLRGTSRQFR